MKEIKLWKIGGPEKSPTVQSLANSDKTKTEDLLETILVKEPHLFFEGLKTVGRQNETPGGALDLLGVGEDGRLIIFELKRGTLTRDAIAQVFDYASYVATLTPAELSEFVRAGSGRNGVEKMGDFDSWYDEQFGGKSIDLIGRPQMVLVGLAADDRAFVWSNSGRIRTLRFR